jgi:hypothetical protein
MLCFPSFLHSNEIDTDLSMLALVVSPALRMKFGSRRGEGGVDGNAIWGWCADSIVAEISVSPLDF